MGGGGSKAEAKYSDKVDPAAPLGTKDIATFKKKLANFGKKSQGDARYLPDSAFKCFSVKDINKFGSWISGSDDNEKLVVFRTITTLATNLKFYQLLAKKKIVIRHWFDFLDKSKANVVVTALKCMLYMMEQNTAKPTEKDEHATKNHFSSQFGYEMCIKYITLFPDNVEVQKAILNILRSALITKSTTTTFSATRKVVELLVPHIAFYLSLCKHKNASLRTLTQEVLNAVFLESLPGDVTAHQTTARDTALLLYLLQTGLQIKASAERATARAIYGTLSDNNKESLSILPRILPKEAVKWTRKPIPKPQVDSPATPSKKKGKKKKSKGADEELAIVLVKTSPKRNWAYFFDQLGQDSENYKLIWNQSTRAELLEKVLDEISDFEIDNSDTSKPVPWDYKDFSVFYSCLDGENQVDGHFIRLLTEVKKIQIDDPVDFMTKCYRKCVVTDPDEWKKGILITMEMVYTTYKDKFLKNFHHMDYLTWLFSPKHCTDEWKNDVTRLMSLLFQDSTNIKGFVYARGVNICIEKLCESLTGAAPKLVRAESATGTDEPPEVNDQNTEKLMQAGYLLDMIDSCLNLKFGRKQLADASNIKLIIQTLLLRDKNIGDKSMVLVKKVLDGMKVLPIQAGEMYTTGIFSFMMLYLTVGFTDSFSAFLKGYHKQSGLKDGMVSFLEFFVPSPVINKLETLSTSEFTKVINSESASPDLFWNDDIKEKIVTHVGRSIRHFMTKSAQDPRSEYEYEEPIPIELDLGLCIGNIYLKLYLEHPEFEIPDPEELLTLMIEKMDDIKLDELILVIKSQQQMFLKYADKPKFQKYEGFPGFLSKATKINDVSVLISIYELFSVILGAGSKENLNLFFKSDGLATTFKLLGKRSEYSTAPAEMLKFSVKLIETIDVICTTDVCQAKILEMKDFFFELAQTFEFKKLKALMPLAIASIKLNLHCLTKQMYKPFMESGAFLQLMQIAVFGNYEDAKSKDYEACNLSMDILTVMYKNDADAKNILDMMLSYALTRLIGGKDKTKLMQSIRAETEDPLLIWSADLREELQISIDKESNKVANNKTNGKDVLWPYTDYSVSYDSIEEEMYIHNVYVSLYNEKPDFKLPDAKGFMTAVLGAMNDIISAGLILDLNTVDEGSKETAKLNRKKKISGVYYKYVAAKEPEIFEEIPDNDFEGKIIADFRMKLTAVAHCLDKATDESMLALITSTHVNIFRTVVAYLGMMKSQGTLLQLAIDLINRLATSAKTASMLIDDITLSLLHSLLHKSGQYENQHTKILEILYNIVQNDVKLCPSLLSLGIFISALSFFSNKGSEREMAAKLLGHSSGKNSEILNLLCNCTADGYRKKFPTGNTEPAELVEYFDDDHETPIIIWNATVRGELLTWVNKEMDIVGAFFGNMPAGATDKCVFQWNYNDSLARYSRPSLEKQLLIEGVYLELYEDNLTFKLPDPGKFMESVMVAINKKYDTYKNIMENEGGSVKMSGQLITMFACVGKAMKQSKDLVGVYASTHLPVTFKFIEPFADSKLKLSVIELLCKLMDKDAAIQGMLESKALAELLKTLTVKCDDDESGQIIMKIIGLIIGLSENADVIKQFNDAGGFLYLINLLLNSANDIKVRAKAAELFIHISVAETSPELTADKICEIYLTSKFKSKFEEASSGFAKYFFSDHKTDARNWDDDNRASYRKFIAMKLETWSSQKWDGTGRFSPDDMKQAFVTKTELIEPVTEPKPEPEPETNTEESEAASASKDAEETAAAE